MKHAIDLMVTTVVVLGLVFALIAVSVGHTAAGGIFLSVLVVSVLHIGNRVMCKEKR